MPTHRSVRMVSSYCAAPSPTVATSVTRGPLPSVSSAPLVVAKRRLVSFESRIGAAAAAAATRAGVAAWVFSGAAFPCAAALGSLSE